MLTRIDLMTQELVANFFAIYINFIKTNEHLENKLEKITWEFEQNKFEIKNLNL